MSRLIPRTLLFIALVLVALGASVHMTQADCINEADCQNQINSQSSQLASIKAQQVTLQGQLNSASRDLNSTQAQLNSFQAQADDIKKQLDGAQATLDKSRDLFKQRVKYLYERGQISDWELFFMDDLSFADIMEFKGLQEAVLNKNIELISQYTKDVNDLTNVKKTADDQLAQVQKIRDAQAAKYNSIARSNNALNSQIKSITSALANLTAQQQQIIAAKLAATSQSTTVGAAPPTSEQLGTSPYGSASFVFLTYGYPHRIGMNQYGAYGRAKAGQNFQQILQAYYGTQATPANEPANITVNGCNDYGECFNNQQFGFEDYLKHIYEMPTSWSMEALKAQAVAARTYAMKAGSTICPSQSCQEAKTEINSTAWQQAVDATAGLVLGGNSPINAFYSSTDGGYTCTDFSHNDPCTPYLVDANGGWSTANAYDGPNYGNSPWFHTFWGLNNGTPWLNATDTADLFNAAILSAYDSNYNQYLSPQSSGGWSYSRVIQELQAKGQPWIDQATAVGVGMDGKGNTTGISVVGANGSAKTLDGKQFRGVFNLRSPGTLVIYTSLYDVQKGG